MYVSKINEITKRGNNLQQGLKTLDIKIKK
jgi:hypothetical protein